LGSSPAKTGRIVSPIGFFYELLFDQIREGNSASVVVEDLFELATNKASADIKRASDASANQAGFLDTTAWHWFGGQFHSSGGV